MKIPIIVLMTISIMTISIITLSSITAYAQTDDFYMNEETKIFFEIPEGWNTYEVNDVIVKTKTGFIMHDSGNYLYIYPGELQPKPYLIGSKTTFTTEGNEKDKVNLDNLLQPCRYEDTCINGDPNTWVDGALVSVEDIYFKKLKKYVDEHDIKDGVYWNELHRAQYYESKYKKLTSSMAYNEKIPLIHIEYREIPLKEEGLNEKGISAYIELAVFGTYSVRNIIFDEQITKESWGHTVRLTSYERETPQHGITTDFHIFDDGSVYKISSYIPKNYVYDEEAVEQIKSSMTLNGETVPEFYEIALLIMIISITTVIVITRKNTLLINFK